MHYGTLSKVLKVAAKAEGGEMYLVREGASCSLGPVRDYRATIGRHTETAEMKARAAIRQVEEDV